MSVNLQKSFWKIRSLEVVVLTFAIKLERQPFYHSRWCLLNTLLLLVQYYNSEEAELSDTIIYRILVNVVKTLMVETKTETWKKFECKTPDQDLKKFSRSRLGEFVRDRDETSRPEILEAKLIRIDYWQPFSWFFLKQTANRNTVERP